MGDLAEWDSSTIAVSDVDLRSAAFQHAPSCSSKSACSTGPHALGGPHHLQAILATSFGGLFSFSGLSRLSHS